VSEHNTHHMDRNSVAAFRECEEKLRGRQGRLLLIYKRNRSGLTDRDVCDIVSGEDQRKHDMNYVRPRITELVKAGLLVRLECDDPDPVTGRPVRRCIYWQFMDEKQWEPEPVEKTLPAKPAVSLKELYKQASNVFEQLALFA